MMSTATETAIEADPKLPIIRITREFAATPGQLFRRPHRPRAVRPVGRPGRRQYADRALGRPHRRQLALRHQARRHGVRVPRLLPRGAPGPHRADLHL